MRPTKPWAWWGATVGLAIALVGATRFLGPPAVATATWLTLASAWWGPRRWGVEDRLSRILPVAAFAVLALTWTGISVVGRGVWPPPTLHQLLFSVVSVGIVGIAASLLRWVQLRSRGRALDGWLEGLLIAAALAAVVAELLFSPYLGGVTEGLHPLSGIAPTLAMTLVVGVGVRLVLTGAERLPSAWLVLAASVLGLIGNTLYSLAEELPTPGVYQGWTATFLLVAAGLAHPSIGELVTPTTPPCPTADRQPWVQVGFIALALGMVAALGANHAVATTGSALPSLMSSVLIVIVVWRLARLLHQRTQESRQEVALSELSRTSLEATSDEALLDAAATVTTRTLGIPARALAQGAPSAEALVGGDRQGGWPIDEDHVLVCDAPLPRRLRGRAEGFLEAVTWITAAGLRRLGTESRLRHRSLHDELTGLPNRALVRDRLRHALTAAAREEHLTGVVFVDLDDFKTINDTYGHTTGDAALTAVADALVDAVRGGDTVGRLSGDEFVVVAPRITAEGLDDLAGRVLAAVQAAGLRLPEDHAHPRLSASVGTALGHPAATVDDLLNTADAAMYRMKDEGGNDHSPTPRYHWPPPPEPRGSRNGAEAGGRTTGSMGRTTSAGDPPGEPAP